MLPSWRAIADHGAGSVPAGATIGGQFCAHDPLHVDWPGAARSASKTYTVKFPALTKPGAPFSVAVDSGTDGDCVGLGFGTGVRYIEGEALYAPAPHPAMSVAATSAPASAVVIDKLLVT